ncbi:MAG: hypothetical protein EKK54_08040 [Neisseriaceae bacterium]|nr:MAG: hypothetical protein EKK54_08040 [Neisseriaceae bacterium]
MGWFTDKLQNGRISMHYKQLEWVYTRLNEQDKGKLIIWIHIALNDVLNEDVASWYSEIMFDTETDRNKLMRLVDLIEAGVNNAEKSHDNIRKQLGVKLNETQENFFAAALRFWICAFASYFLPDMRSKTLSITKSLQTYSSHSLDAAKSMLELSTAMGTPLNVKDPAEHGFITLHSNADHTLQTVALVLLSN